MQNPNNVKSSIELKSNRDVEALPKSIIIKTIVTVNAIALCAFPLKPGNAIDLLNKKMAIESRSNMDINIYPTKHIRCENGKVISETENFEDGNTSVTIGISNTEPTVNIKFQQIINDLEEENAMLKRRLEKSLPVHAISYIALNSVLLTFCDLINIKVCLWRLYSRSILSYLYADYINNLAGYCCCVFKRLEEIFK